MLSDLLNAVRMARRNAGLTAVAVLLVGLGVGLNTAVYTVARTLVFRPLPFREPGRVVSLWRESVQTGSSFGASWPNLEDWRQQRDLFEGVEAYQYSASHALASGAGTAGPVSEFQVTGGFFPLLGVYPAQGRTFQSHELAPQTTAGAPGPILVSHQFWQQRLQGRTDVLAQTVRVGALTYRVAGVLPRGFRVFRNDAPEVFTPLRPFPGHLQDRRMTYLEPIARLRPGIALGQARAALDAYSRRAAREHPRTDAGLVCRLGLLHERLFGSMRPVMTVLLTTVGLVLLVACGNLAILLSVRGVRRRREMAVRAALGGGRLRIAWQLTAESLVLSLAGGAAGLLLAVWATDLFSACCSSAGLELPALTMDGSVFLFAFLVSTVTGLVFGAAPVCQVWQLDLQAGLRGASPGGPQSLARHFLSGGLVAAEIALSTVLLIGAGLLLLSLARMGQVDPGFRVAHVLTMSVGEAPHSAEFRRREAAFWAELLERVRALPGVESAAFSGTLPLAAQQSPENMKTPLLPGGRDEAGQAGLLQAEYQDVSPGYFGAIGIPLRRGRIFAGTEDDAAAVVINEHFARECWGAADPIGKRLTPPGGRPYTVVGVVGDVRQYSLRGEPVRRQVYRPLGRLDVATLTKWPSRYLAVRTAGNPERLAPLLREVVRNIDPARPVIRIRSMQDLVLGSTAWDRMRATVVSLFAGIALVLTLAGVYAVVSHSVSRRRREIGIRMALGGQPGEIRRMILREAASIIAAGIGSGILAALVLAPLVSDQLFGVGMRDVPALAAGVALLLGAGLTASYMPVRRATRLDLLTELRAE